MVQIADRATIRRGHEEESADTFKSAESQYREVSVAIPTKGMSSPLKVLIEVTFARCLWPVVMVSKRVKPCRFDDLLLLGATRDRLIYSY